MFCDVNQSVIPCMILCRNQLDSFWLFIAGIKLPAKDDMMFNSSMCDSEDFFKWLKSKGVSDRDQKILKGKIIMIL